MAFWPRARRWLWLLVIAVVVIVWESAARYEIVSLIFFPAPSKIANTLLRLVADGTVGESLGISLTRLLLGMLVGGLPGLLLGLALGWSKPLREIIDPLIAAVHPIPKISVLPMIIIIFGIGERSRIIVIALATFFPMLINAMAGVIQIDPTYFEAARNYGAKWFRQLRRVVLPGSLPYVLTGLRLAMNSALVLTIAIELIMSNNGLGEMIGRAWRVLRVDELYASLCVVSALGISMNVLLSQLRRRLAPWDQNLDQG